MANAKIDFAALAGVMLKAVNVNPDRRIPRKRDARRFLRGFGYEYADATLAKLAVTGGGCPYEIHGNKAYYRAADLLEWALSRAQRPEDGPQMRAARARRARGERLGRPPRDMSVEATAA